MSALKHIYGKQRYLKNVFYFPNSTCIEFVQICLELNRVTLKFLKFLHLSLVTSRVNTEYEYFLHTWVRAS